MHADDNHGNQLNESDASWVPGRWPMRLVEKVILADTGWPFFRMLVLIVALAVIWYVLHGQ